MGRPACARYTTLETISQMSDDPMSDDPIISLRQWHADQSGPMPESTATNAISYTTSVGKIWKKPPPSSCLEPKCRLVDTSSRIRTESIEDAPPCVGHSATRYPTLFTSIAKVNIHFLQDCCRSSHQLPSAAGCALVPSTFWTP